MFEWIALSVICVLLIVGFIWCVWATEQHCNRLALGVNRRY